MEHKSMKGLVIIDCSKHLEMREVESIPKSFYRISLIHIFFCH